MAKNSVDIDLTETDQPHNHGAIVIDEDAALPIKKNDADVVEDIDPNDRLPDHAIQNDDGTVTLPLLFPQTLTIKKAGNVREEKYDTLTFHRLTGADQRAIGAVSPEMMNVVAFARTTRISQTVMNVLFDRLDAADINAGALVLNSFFATGRKTGK